MSVIVKTVYHHSMCLDFFPDICKLSVVNYSDKLSQATPSVKKLPYTQKHHCLLSTKNVQNQKTSPNFVRSPDQRKATRYVDITNNEKQRNLYIRDEQEWQCIKLDSSKLRKHCFMLSKIRLTCKTCRYL